MTDNDIINFFYPKKLSILTQLLKHNNIPDDVLEYMNNRFNDSDSLYETLYRIKNKIEEKPKCKKCGKELKFILKYSKGHFNEYCSRSCQIDNDNIKHCIKEKYNVENISQLDFVKEKVKQTVKNRYGVKNVFNIQKSINKSRKTRSENKEQWISKIKTTCNEIYGVDNVAKSNIIKEKIKETNIKKYGETSWTKTVEGRQKLSNIVSSKLVQEKTIKTKLLNNTFNKSKPEDKTYTFLKTNFDNVIRQYKSLNYPFCCDFYIPKFDLYIECNYHWTHGKHPYKNDYEDNIILEKWKNKNTRYYNNAINTWTKRDPKKLKIMENNCKNFIVAYNYDEFMQKIKLYIS